MRATTSKLSAMKNGNAPAATPTKLGRILRRLSDQHAQSGAKLMNRRELEREIAARRGQR